MKTISNAIKLVLVVSIFIIISNLLFITNANATYVDWIMDVQAKQHVKQNRQVAERIVNAVFTASLKHDVDPELLFKVIYIESKFNTNLTSREGAKGLTQVIPRYHREKIKGRNIFNIEANIDVGAQAYAEYAHKYPTVKMALAAYNGRLKHNPYPDLVLSVKIPDTMTASVPTPLPNAIVVTDTVTPLTNLIIGQTQLT